VTDRETGWQSTVILYLRAKINFHARLPNSTDLHEIWYEIYPCISIQVTVSFMTISAVKVILYIYGRNKNLYFPHLLPNLGKVLGMASTHNVVQHFEFCENQCRKGHTFLMGINEVTVMHVRWNHDFCWK
jgi:hypothetical protein